MRAFQLLYITSIIFLSRTITAQELPAKDEELSDSLLSNQETSTELTVFEKERRLVFNPSYSVAVVSNTNSKPVKGGRSDDSDSQPKSLVDSRTDGLQAKNIKKQTNNLEVNTTGGSPMPQNISKTYSQTTTPNRFRFADPSEFEEGYQLDNKSNVTSEISLISSETLSPQHKNVYETSNLPNNPSNTSPSFPHTTEATGISTKPQSLASTSESVLHVQNATPSSVGETIKSEPTQSTEPPNTSTDSSTRHAPDHSDDYQLLVTEILPTQKVDISKIHKEPSSSKNVGVQSTSLPPDEVKIHSIDDKVPDSLVDTQLMDESQTSDNKNGNVVLIRKCCEKLEFFSLSTMTCEPITENEIFFNLINGILLEKDQEIEMISSQLKCPDNQGPNTTPGVSNSSYIIIDAGNVYDTVSGHIYNHSEYCLELVGREFNSSLLTIAYCEKLSTDYIYEEYPDSLGVDYYQEETLDSYDLTVRKCCQEFEYYNSQLHKCVPLGNANKFHDSVKQISFGSENVGLNIISSRLRGCPNQVDLPSIHTLDPTVFRLRYNGDIIDTSTGLQYDYSYYCLEHIGDTNETMILNIALCNKANFLLPKCCPNGHYFDEDELNCLQIPKNHNLGQNLLQEFLLDNNTYALEELSYFLPCQNALPAKELADNFLFRDGRLCLQETCYGRVDFCVDYVGSSQARELQPVAYYCRKNFFVKCCKENKILHEDGCMDYSDGNSLLLKQLTRTRSMVQSFNYKDCSDERALLLEDSFTKYIQWWLDDSGTHLVVESSTQVKEVRNYCIDDFKDPDGKVSPSAYVCESEVENMIPIEKTQRIFQRKGSLGKCCPKSPDSDSIYFFSSVHGDCQIIGNNGSLALIKYFNETAYNKEHFHDFPKCSNGGKGYHAYPLRPGNYDHAQLTNDGDLKIISMEGKCIQQEELITDRDFCFEYIMNVEGKLEPSVVVCAYTSVLEIYNEKFTLVTALLSISCACLFATLISLCTTRVRRGLVSTRKIHTLAGRILVSFVGSHLIGYFSLALMLHDNSLNKETSPSCYILAALIQFFNLATFCWNTSICLESLLLTIHIRISEFLRYFLHSLWAWGFPAFMTILMLLMDAYKDELPCGTITPNIGLHHCFHSNTEARLLYFYVPIFITLTSNVMFLVGAKALRNSRLRRLEKGKPIRNTQKPTNETNSADPNNSQGHSGGMRTHQTQNTKVESLRLVLWTGGTWFLELAGFIITKYILPHSRERWFEYLWYIPTSINALRGVGIFAIIVLTPETRTKICNVTAGLRDQVSSRVRSYRASQTDSKAFPSNGSQSTFNENRRRNLSITTMISNISYFRNSSVTGKNKESKADLNQSNCNDKGYQTNMVRSVSQNERKASLTSLSPVDKHEFSVDKGRRCSIPMNNIMLPDLHEEGSPHAEISQSDMSSTDV